MPGESASEAVYSDAVGRYSGQGHSRAPPGHAEGEFIPNERTRGRF